MKLSNCSESPWGSLLALGTLVTLGALLTLWPLLALGSLLTLRPLLALGALLALRPLIALIPLIPLGPLRAFRTNRADGQYISVVPWPRGDRRGETAREEPDPKVLFGYFLA